MSKPQELRIGPYIWTISFLGRNSDICGETLVRDLEIVIYDSHEQVQKETLMHEVLHASIFSAGLNEWISEKEEETFCRVLSPVLWKLISDNPDLIRFLSS